MHCLCVVVVVVACQVWNLTMSMLGSQEKPTLHSCKAAEARGLLEFTTVLLDRYKHKFRQGKTEFQQNQNELEGKLLQGAAEAAWKFERVMQDNRHQRRMDRNVQEQLMFEYHRFVVLFHRIQGVDYLPKTHAMYHLIMKTGFNGNPLFYHNYANESLNGEIAKIARSCHRSSWGEAVLSKFRLAQLVHNPRAR